MEISQENLYVDIETNSDSTQTGEAAMETEITLLGKSQRQAQRLLGSIVDLKHQTNIRCWNECSN